MATIFKIVKRVPSELPHGTAKPGFKGFLVDKGERALGAAAFGFSKTYFGDRFIWGGHGADAWIGGVGLLGIALAHATGSARGLVPHVERFVDAAFMSAVGSRAAAYGLEKAGHHVTVTQAKPGQKGIHGDILGAITGAKQGAYLSPDRLANFAQRR